MRPLSVYLTSSLIDQIMASHRLMFSVYSVQKPGTQQSDTRVYPAIDSFLFFFSLSEVVDRRIIVEPRGRATLNGEERQQEGERERGGSERERGRRRGERERWLAVVTSTDHRLRSIL